MSAKPEADPQLGRTLGGQYRIEALLGAGGMGRVYRGRQLSVNRPVAIKVIAGQAPYPPEWVRRFRREAEATASLSHPNSVRLFDFGVTEAEELFMVMELLEGCDLARQLQAHGPLPLVAALGIARQVLLALCEAHELGITHRDIKPDNIFLASVRGADVVAKVMDFGIAGIAQTQRKSRLTGAGMIIGTPMYMSPEQAQGLRVDGKSDIYSLGVVLFEMLTGRPVFESHTAVTLLLAHVARAPMRLEEAGVQLREHSSLQALLDRLLAKEPSERPTAAEALETVTSLSTRLGIAGATGTMRALDLDAAALPQAKARRGKSSSSAARAAAQNGAKATPQPAHGATPQPALSSQVDRAQPASAARSSRGPHGPPPPSAAAQNPASIEPNRNERNPTPPSAALPLEAELAESSSAGRHFTPRPDALSKEARARRGPDADAQHVARDALSAMTPSAALDQHLHRGDQLDAPLLASDDIVAVAGRDAEAQHEAGLGFDGDDTSSDRSARQFRRARAASAPTGAWLRPGFALLGTALVLGAASALALRWGPTLLEAARPATALVTEAATPVPPREQRTVLINSQPSGANVVVEGEKVGTTPFQLKVQSDTEISLARDGYVRQLVQVPYDAPAQLQVKLAAQPVDKAKAREASAKTDSPFSFSLRQESHPRIPRADSENERRERSAQQPAARAPVDGADEDVARANSDHERREPYAQPPSAALAARAPVDRADEGLPRIAPRADSDHERRERSAQPPVAALAARGPVARAADSVHERRDVARTAGAAREPIERVDPEPDVYRLSEAPGPLQHEETGQSAGLDVARVLEMGRDGDSPRSTRTLDRERAAELASEHGSARDDLRNPDARRHAEAQPTAAETSRSAATSIEAIREDEVAEIALDDDERAHVAQHYGLRAIGRAVARAFGRLLIPYPNRDRRAALARMPLMYSSFREARAAYKSRDVDATGFQEAVWQLRERRRQRIWTERDRYARGELSQGQYEAKVDRIWDEFWGQR